MKSKKKQPKKRKIAEHLDFTKHKVYLPDLDELEVEALTSYLYDYLKENSPFFMYRKNFDAQILEVVTEDKEWVYQIILEDVVWHADKENKIELSNNNELYIYFTLGYYIIKPLKYFTKEEYISVIEASYKAEALCYIKVKDWRKRMRELVYECYGTENLEDLTMEQLEEFLIIELEYPRFCGRTTRIGDSDYEHRIIHQKKF